MDQPGPFKFIRERVFGVKLAQDFAAEIGVTPGHLSRLENGGGRPSHELMERVRDAARERGVDWDDRYFFEAPATAENGAEAER